MYLVTAKVSYSGIQVQHCLQPPHNNQCCLQKADTYSAATPQVTPLADICAVLVAEETGEWQS